MSSKKSSWNRNGKIDSTPLRIRRLVCLSRERYERIKGIVKVKCKEIVRERINKKLSAKTEKANIVKDSHIDSCYIPSHIVYVRKGKPRGWWRVNEWFKELEDYELAAKKYLIKK